MASVSNVNGTPISSISTSALSQNVANNQVSGSLTIPVVNTASPSTSLGPTSSMNTNNSANTTLNVNLLGESISHQKVLSKQRLLDLAAEVDSNVQTDEDVEELLLNIAEDFIDDIVETSCKYAKHRNSNILEIKDVQLSLEKNWNMWIPGFGTEELRPYKKSSLTEAHKQRMGLIHKAKRKM